MRKPMWMIALAALAIAGARPAHAGYLDENPDDVFADVYGRLGVDLPAGVARDPVVWRYLDELRREPCDQTSVNNLALVLEKVGHRREAAEGLYNFVRKCGAPNSALHRSVDILLKLTDYPKAVEVADEFIRRAPDNHDAHYLRGVALEGAGDFRRALADYADAIELFGSDRKKISSRVFLRMAAAYAALGQFCEAATPILTWVAFDPAARDTSQTRKIVADYEQRGNCVQSTQFHKERYPLRGARDVVTAKADINGVRGVFVIDTGASHAAISPKFAGRAKIAYADANDITIRTANGLVKGKLSTAEKVALGTLEATHVPVVVQEFDLGRGIDGLLGMSFLSRFDVRMAGGYMEIRTRGQK